MATLTYEFVKNRLKETEGKGLPGVESHKKMAPPQRIDLDYNPQPDDAQESAVLILLYYESNQLHIPLIKRPVDGSVHSGQIALPGGKKEQFDSDHLQTALRETQEEIGLRVEEKNIIGELSPLYIPVSNFIVRPVVAYIPHRPGFRVNPLEVDELLNISLDELMHSEVTTKRMSWKNIPIDIPFFCIGKADIWGATAMIMSEFLDVLQKKTAPEKRRS